MGKKTRKQTNQNRSLKKSKFSKSNKTSINYDNDSIRMRVTQNLPH